jgi:hypothetical protein
MKNRPSKGKTPMQWHPRIATSGRAFFAPATFAGVAAAAAMAPFPASPGDVQKQRDKPREQTARPLSPIRPASVPPQHGPSSPGLGAAIAPGLTGAVDSKDLDINGVRDGENSGARMPGRASPTRSRTARRAARGAAATPRSVPPSRPPAATTGSCSAASDDVRPTRPPEISTT